METWSTQGIVSLLREWIQRKRESVETLKQSQSDNTELYCAGMVAVLDDLEATILRAYGEHN